MKGSPSSPNMCVVSIEMTDEDVIQKVAKIFATSVYKPKKRGEYKQTYVARVKGKRAVEIMTQVQNLMSVRRQAQIQMCLNSYTPFRRKIDEVVLAKMKEFARLGYTHKKIAESLGLCRESVTKHLNN